MQHNTPQPRLKIWCEALLGAGKPHPSEIRYYPLKSKIIAVRRRESSARSRNSKALMARMSVFEQFSPPAIDSIRQLLMLNQLKRALSRENCGRDTRRNKVEHHPRLLRTQIFLFFCTLYTLLSERRSWTLYLYGNISRKSKNLTEKVRISRKLKTAILLPHRQNVSRDRSTSGIPYTCSFRYYAQVLDLWSMSMWSSSENKEYLETVR